MSINPESIPLTAFGHVNNAEETPVIQTSFYYGLGSKSVSRTLSGGAVTASGGEVICQTGTTVNAYARSLSKRFLIYKAGQGAVVKFTARFTTGVADSLQQAGFLTVIDGAGFGYNGTVYGTYHKHNGEQEIRNLQITAAAGGVESLTIVVDGDSHTFSVSTGTAQHNTQEIALELDANIAGWSFQQIDDDVISFFQNDGAQSGSYTFTNNTGGGTCAGTWTQVNAGVTSTIDWTAQANWSEDPSPFTVDPTKGNVYQVPFQYLGFGAIQYFIEDPATGGFVFVHQVKYANNNTTPLFANPALSVGWNSESTGSTTNLTVNGGSGGIFIQGKNIVTELPRADQNSNASVSTTLTNIIAIRNRLTFGGISNHSEIIPTELFVSTDGTKGIEVEVFIDPVVATVSNDWQFVNESNSITLVDKSAATYSSGGRFISGAELQPSGVIDLEKLGVVLLPGESLCVFAKVSATPSAQINAVINWKEDI